ncbi:MAG: putative toxin-antitoxin system toxin component, PIN family, partial [Bacteroidetes bacterium]|nr:putative toxin-antitoxin system toxin component, PIN family [Bacteroidota bacterium]
MQKIVIDTNVFVSALIQRGYSYHIVNGLFIEGKIDLCVSDEVLEEYFSVLKRKRFQKYPDFVNKAEILIADIETKSTKFTPTTKLTIISDKDDNKFLELSSECKADFLITGNTNDFTIKRYKRTKIMTPKEYWENYKP